MIKNYISPVQYPCQQKRLYGRGNPWEHIDGVKGT